MTGVRITIEARGLEEAFAAIARLADLDKAEAMDSVGALVASQTQRRIEVEKTAPDGGAWPANIEGTSILFRTGALAQSVAHQVSGNQVMVGSNLVYAAIHQFGGKIEPKSANSLAFSVGGAMVFAKSVTIPARPWLGISPENAREIETMVADLIEDMVH